TDRLSQNPYIYCQNDPVNHTDRTGRRIDAYGGTTRPTAKQQVQANKVANAARKKRQQQAKAAAKKKAADDVRRLAAKNPSASGKPGTSGLAAGIAARVRTISNVVMFGGVGATYEEFVASPGYKKAMRYAADVAEGAASGYGLMGGSTAHALITADYLKTHGTARANYWVPGGGLKGNGGFADIYDTWSGETFEIKPGRWHNTPYLKRLGEAQLASYMHGLVAQGLKTRADMSYGSKLLGAYSAGQYFDSPGMIYYETVQRSGASVPVPARRTAEQDSRVQSLSMQPAYAPAYASTETFATVTAGGVYAEGTCSTDAGAAVGAALLAYVAINLFELLVGTVASGGNLFVGAATAVAVTP
ncbi:MAG: hypothetical protein JXA36_03740, partial [Coriobacteriia bacterium]|nr:hypothetical protein [Coriobacteriia bacterium]